METDVLLNESLIKKYYLNMFFRKLIFLEISILVFGSTGATIYLLDNLITQGIALEFLTLFFTIVIFFIFFKRMNMDASTMKGIEKTFNYYFEDKELIIKNKSIVDTISYKYIKIKKFKDIYEIRSKETKTGKIYLIPLYSFTKEEWINIKGLIKKGRR